MVNKDILVVVHDAYDHVAKCLESVCRHTEGYQLYVWDNGSAEPTQRLLEDFRPYRLVRSPVNEGHIRPCNALARLTQPEDGHDLFLLNSDVVVKAGWAEALQEAVREPAVGAAAYMGRKLTEDGDCAQGDVFDVPDYLELWAGCIPRRIYDEFGLWDDYFKFAYCEDSDFGLRLRRAQYRLVALDSGLAVHHGGATSSAVMSEGNALRRAFERNQELFKRRWGFTSVPALV